MSQFFPKEMPFSPSVPFTVRSCLSHQDPKEHYFPSSDGKIHHNLPIYWWCGIQSLWAHNKHKEPFPVRLSRIAKLKNVALYSLTWWKCFTNLRFREISTTLHSTGEAPHNWERRYLWLPCGWKLDGHAISHGPLICSSGGMSAFLVKVWLNWPLTKNTKTDDVFLRGGQSWSSCRQSVRN